MIAVDMMSYIKSDLVTFGISVAIIFALMLYLFFGNRTTIEAASVGTKIAGWNHGGTKEILNELFPQGLVELGNLTDLKNKSIDLLSQDELRPEKNTEDVMALFKQLHKNGQTIIVITHEEDIANQAERVITIRDGLIESDKMVHENE